MNQEIRLGSRWVFQDAPDERYVAWLMFVGPSGEDYVAYYHEHDELAFFCLSRSEFLDMLKPEEL